MPRHRLAHSHIVAALRSSRGHNAMVFLIFIAVAALLWWVMALNDEDQCDIRMPLHISHVPDSVTIITPAPQAIAVSVRAKGSQLLKLYLGHVPQFDIDFRAFRSGSSIRLTDADLKAIARSSLDGSVVTIVNPDSLNLHFTTNQGIAVPIRLDYSITPGPQATLSAAPVLSVDSTRVFSESPGDAIQSVTTEPVRLTGLNQTTVRRVRLMAPKGTRLIPDSIDVTFRVEPLILKSRTLTIESIGVPAGHKLITFPARVRVSYMIPMSAYKKSEPHMRVVADYRTIDTASSSRMMRIRLIDVPENLRNVQLAQDSVEYIIEKL